MGPRTGESFSVSVRFVGSHFSIGQFARGRLADPEIRRSARACHDGHQFSQAIWPVVVWAVHLMGPAALRGRHALAEWLIVYQLLEVGMGQIRVPADTARRAQRHEVRLWHTGSRALASQVRLLSKGQRVVDSTPRYRTVLSIRRWPRSNWTVLRLPVLP